MAALDPSVAALRTALRQALGPGLDRPLVLVACSGGPDSLALAATAGFVAPRLGWRAGLITVDHGLQPGSGQVAEQVAAWAGKAGLDPVEVVPVRVAGAGAGPSFTAGAGAGSSVTAGAGAGSSVTAGRPGGPEAAARQARYAGLATAATRLGAAVVLLGHTRDDQAETVLLALARGAGPRGLAGMPPRRERGGVVWLRPLLDTPRAQTRAACDALGLEPWDDPHNTDPAYARTRVRQVALPALVAALGERVVDNLARTARQLAADTAALDGLAAEALDAARTPGGLSVPALSRLPDAIRTRVLHAWARELGAPGSALSHRHVAALDALVMEWHGQGPTHLPSGLTVTRRADHLICVLRPGAAGAGECR